MNKISFPNACRAEGELTALGFALRKLAYLSVGEVEQLIRERMERVQGVIKEYVLQKELGGMNEREEGNHYEESVAVQRRREREEEHSPAEREGEVGG